MYTRNREKVHIPKSKQYIFMRGNGKGRTSIVWSESSHDNVASATFRLEASHFIAFGISFKVCTHTYTHIYTYNHSSLINSLTKIFIYLRKSSERSTNRRCFHVTKPVSSGIRRCGQGCILPLCIL